MQETRVRSLGRGDPLEEEMATGSSILAWETPCTEEPGGPQSVESQRAGHSLATEHAHTGNLNRRCVCVRVCAHVCARVCARVHPCVRVHTKSTEVKFMCLEIQKRKL